MTTIRFFAAARAAVGVDEVDVDPGAGDGSLDAALGSVDPVDGTAWRTVLARSSFLVDGVTTRDRSVPLHGVRQVDVMPPFAGG